MMMMMMMMMAVPGIHLQACRFLKLHHHHTHSYYEKKEYHHRTNYSIHKRDRTEYFDDYFPCQKDNCILEHVRNWFNLFIDVHIIA
jgi:putative transposase